MHKLQQTTWTEIAKHLHLHKSQTHLTMSLQRSMLQHDIRAPMVYNNNFNGNCPLHLQEQLHLQQKRERDRYALQLNNRACVMVISKRNYSEANELFDSALMIHKEQTEKVSSSGSVAFETTASLPQHECYDGCDASSHSYDNDGELDDEYDDLGDMDCDWDNSGKDDVYNLHASKTQTSSKIPRMTSYARLQSIPYSGQQEYHQERYGQQQSQYHQVYSLPIVMEETEWDTAPTQDKSFVLIFNTALCNHLWGMQLMQQYLAATSGKSSNNSLPTEAMAQHCRETLTVAKLLYKLALENSVSFANGVDKMCYVALYNNLSHVCKTLEGYESMEAQWCDDMLLKAIFWWRDSTQQYNTNNNINNLQMQSRSNNTSSDVYLDDDLEIMDVFFDNVYYRMGVPEEIAPAAAA